MKQLILLLLAIFPNAVLIGQNNDLWFEFSDKNSELIGYKDQNDTVKIEPKYERILSSRAIKFKDIMAVEDKSGRYYLTKSGKIVGRDSIYIFDFSSDCESEGFIRFKNIKKQTIGMFNKDGNVIIPADYNYLSEVRNGMTKGLIGAKKEPIDEEHSRFVGGKYVLLDTLNNVLIDNFKYDCNFNFFTLEKTTTEHPDKTRVSFLAKDGKYYSFVDFEKKFKEWLSNDLLKDLTKEKLIAASYDIISWESSNNSKSSDKHKFINRNFETLKTGLSKILNPECEYFIHKDYSSLYRIEETGIEKFLNNCGDYCYWIFPKFNLTINHKTTQWHYDFLWTGNEYKLISVSMQDEKLK
jgi:hypothetical protein